MIDGVIIHFIGGSLDGQERQVHQAARLYEAMAAGERGLRLEQYEISEGLGLYRGKRPRALFV